MERKTYIQPAPNRGTFLTDQHPLTYEFTYLDTARRSDFDSFFTHSQDTSVPVDVVPAVVAMIDRETSNISKYDPVKAQSMETYNTMCSHIARELSGKRYQNPIYNDYAILYSYTRAATVARKRYEYNALRDTLDFDLFPVDRVYNGLKNDAGRLAVMNQYGYTVSFVDQVTQAAHQYDPTADISVARENLKRVERDVESHLINPSNRDRIHHLALKMGKNYDSDGGKIKSLLQFKPEYLGLNDPDVMKALLQKPTTQR